MSKIATAFIKRKTDEAVALVQERKVLDPRARVAKDLLAMWPIDLVAAKRANFRHET